MKICLKYDKTIRTFTNNEHKSRIKTLERQCVGQTLYYLAPLYISKDKDNQVYLKKSSSNGSALTLKISTESEFVIEAVFALILKFENEFSSKTSLVST